MPAFTEETIESILSTCGGNTAALAESLSQCFDRPYRLEAGDSGMWSTDDVPGEFRGPGILALIQVESQAIAVLIPQSLPLPDWYLHPNDSQTSRLETLAMEWSMNLIPATLEAEKFKSLVVDDIAAAVTSMAPAEWAATLTLNVFEGADASESPVAKLLVIWPLEQPNLEAIVTVDPVVAVPQSVPVPPIMTAPARDPLARLRHLSIEVSVRLAEKKIPMSQLLGITPGMLITFNKSCDDLLDLYVNNSRYCRGEAVKIGENFGLKINQVGVADDPQRKVIDA